MLSVEHLSVTYASHGASVVAVDDVNFTIAPGEIFALVGESGSGKSSVALALTKLLVAPPALIGGRVRFEGLDLLKASAQQLEAIRGGRIADVFQDPSTSLNPVLAIGEQLVEAIELHTDARGHEAKRIAIEWLQRVGIAAAPERWNAYPHELSGGMQQRVMLAMAMTGRPALLIADEPTTALDVLIQVQLLRLLRDLQRTYQLAVLLVSHDLVVVERMAHRVGVMSSGKLVEVGDVAHVLGHPSHPYTQQLVHDRSILSLPTEHQRHD